MQIGKAIKKLRIQFGYTQRELAEKFPCSKQLVSNWERGCTAVKPRQCERIAEIFNITAEQIELLGKPDCQVKFSDRKNVAHEMPITGREKVFIDCLRLLEDGDRDEIEELISFKLSRQEASEVLCLAKITG